MQKNKNQYSSIYIKKSVLKSNTSFTPVEINRIAVKKLMNNNVTPQTFYKPITRTITIKTDVS